MEPKRQDFFNPQSSTWQLQQIPPQDLNFNAIYTVPEAEFIPKYLRYAAKDWQIGWFANYQSGQFLAPPTSPTLNFFQSEDIRVAGQPLYTPGVNINDHSSFNPYTTQVLNPAAWAPCPQNAACASTSVYYKDFRGPRTPTENANIGRNFRFGPEGKFNLYIRAEFVNIFNRTLMPNPVTANPVPHRCDEPDRPWRRQRPVIPAASESSTPTCPLAASTARRLTFRAARAR